MKSVIDFFFNQGVLIGKGGDGDGDESCHLELLLMVVGSGCVQIC